MIEFTMKDGYCIRKPDSVAPSVTSESVKSSKCLGKWENIVANIERNRSNTPKTKLKDVKSKVFAKISTNQNILICANKDAGSSSTASDRKKNLFSTVPKTCKKTRSDTKSTNSVEKSKTIKADKTNLDKFNLIERQLQYTTKAFDALSIVIQQLNLRAEDIGVMKYKCLKLEDELKKATEECHRINEQRCNTNENESGRSNGIAETELVQEPTATDAKKSSIMVHCNGNRGETRNENNCNGNGSKRDFDPARSLQTKNENEIKSLQTVLDLKMSELADLRISINNLQHENEQLKTVAAKVPSLETKIRKLEMQLAFKTESEQKLLQENRKKDEELNLQQNRSNDQARVIEQLRYKLQRKNDCDMLDTSPRRPNCNRNSTGSYAETSIFKNRESLLYYTALDSSQSFTAHAKSPLQSPVSPVSPRIKSYVEKSASASWVLEMDDLDVPDNNNIDFSRINNNGSIGGYFLTVPPTETTASEPTPRSK